jgi:hypothetical protein
MPEHLEEIGWLRRAARRPGNSNCVVFGVLGDEPEFKEILAKIRTVMAVQLSRLDNLRRTAELNQLSTVTFGR